MSTFKKNPFVERKIAQDAATGAILKARISTAERMAKTMAPVDTGDYRDGIRGEVELVPEVGWIGRLNGYDFKSHWIEFGTATGYPARAILRLAVERVGFHVTRTHQ